RNGSGRRCSAGDLPRPLPRRRSQASRRDRSLSATQGSGGPHDRASASTSSPSGNEPMRSKASKEPAAKISAQAAAALVRSGMWLDYGVSHGQPDVFDKALAARLSELTDVKIRSCLSVTPRPSLEADPEGRHVRLYSWHFSGYDRGKHDAGRCSYVPVNLGEVPDYYRRFIDPIDIAVLKVGPMDKNGRL